MTGRDKRDVVMWVEADEKGRNSIGDSSRFIKGGSASSTHPNWAALIIKFQKSRLVIGGR